MKASAVRHVNFIDDIDLALAPGGRKANLFPQLTDLIDAPVRRAVDFQDVHALVVGNPVQSPQLPHGSGVGPFFAVERLGQQPRHCRLARSPRAAEQIGLHNAVRTDGILQRLNDVVLRHHVLKHAGAAIYGRSHDRP